MLQAVIFDMDGVLIDSEPLHQAADLDLLQQLGITPPAGYLAQFTGMANPEMWRQIASDFRLTLDIPALLHTQELLKIARLQREPWQAIVGVGDLIDALAAAGVRMGVASSSSPGLIAAVLQRIGLADRLPVTLSGETMAHSKPAPDIFLAMADRLGVTPAHCVVIEDAHHGVTAAKRAGMACVAYRNPGSGNQDLSAADLCIDHFSALDVARLRGLVKGVCEC